MLVASLIQETGAISALSAWESFYVIVGSSSAALTGLMFVVVSLIAERRTASLSQGVAAFATPTVVHFCAAFLLSSVLSAPWHSVSSPALLVMLIGLAGVIYVLI